MDGFLSECHSIKCQNLIYRHKTDIIINYSDGNVLAILIIFGVAFHKYNKRKTNKMLYSFVHIKLNLAMNTSTSIFRISCTNEQFQKNILLSL